MKRIRRNEVLVGLILVLLCLFLVLSTGCGKLLGESEEEGVTGTPGTSPPQQPQVRVKAFVVTTDYTTGSFSIIDLSDYSVLKSIAQIHSDAVAHSEGGKIYVINRLGQDNIMVYDASSDFSAPLIQFSTGNGSNPYGIALVNASKAYIPLYGKDYILIVDPTTGQELGRIDVSGYADADGIPEVAAIVISQQYAYAMIQRLDRNNWFTPTGNGILLKIDTATDAVLDSLELSFEDPIDMKLLPNGNLAIACVGTYSVMDGGIEVVDLGQFQSLGTPIDEATLGGDIGGAYHAFAMDDNSVGFAIVMDANYNTSVVRFDLSTGTVLGSVHQAQGFYHSDVAVRGGLLYICYRDPAEPGVLVFDADTGEELTDAPVDVGLPPTVLVFFEVST